MKKVITYGTFDLFHKGHYNILKRAKDLGDYLVVGVTSDNYDLDRGKLNVRDSLVTRMKNVLETGLADEVIIEEYQGQKVEDVKRYGIDTFVVGSDWIGKFDYLKEYCNVVYLERTKNISSTQLRCEGAIYRVGLMIGSNVDPRLIEETKLVSGLNVEAVFSQDEAYAERFAREEEIEFYTSKYSVFLDSVDIIYMTSNSITSEQAVMYLEQAIQCKKHVVCNMSVIDDESAVERLFELAEENGVLLWDDLPIAYIRAFDQMLWFIKGNAIGQLYSLNINITCDAENMVVSSVRRAKYLALYVILKIFDSNFYEMRSHVKNGYESCYFHTNQGEVYIRVGTKCDVKNGLEIIGSDGRLVMSDEWWNVTYYRMNKHFSEQKERHSYTFAGNGIRYVLNSLLKSMKSASYNVYRISPDETKKLVKLLNQVD